MQSVSFPLVFTGQAPVGVRQLKRRATANAITEHMLRLTLERGFDAVTIDQVAEAAQVSRRTFFNYFASKEDALFGTPMADLAPRVIDRFVAGGPSGDLIADLLTLVSDQSVFNTADLRCMHDLHHVVAADPTLLVAFKQRLHSRQDDLAALIGARENADPAEPRIRSAVALLNTVMSLTMDRTASQSELSADDMSGELHHTLALLQGLLNPPLPKD